MEKPHEMQSIFDFFFSNDSHPQLINLFKFNTQNPYKKLKNCMDYNYPYIENTPFFQNGGTD